MNKLMIGACFAALAAVAGWLYWDRPSEKVGEVVIATPAKEVALVPVIDVPVRSVKVYKGGATVKKKLNLPATVVEDKREEVLASSKIAAGEHSKTVTTVLYSETGRSETFVWSDPLPWLAYESRGEIGAY